MAPTKEVNALPKSSASVVEQKLKWNARFAARSESVLSFTKAFPLQFLGRDSRNFMLQHADRFRDVCIKKSINERPETPPCEHQMQSSIIHSHEHQMNPSWTPKSTLKCTPKICPKMHQEALKMNPPRGPRIDLECIPKWTPKWMPKCNPKCAPKIHPRSHSQARPCTHSVQRFVRIPYKKCRRIPFLQTSLPKFALYGFRTKPKSKK